MILIIGVYLWSGIHKLSPNFIDSTFYSIVKGFLGINNEALIKNYSFFGYTIPIIELLIAIFLIIPKFRTIAIYTVIVSHLFIIIYLSPLGINFNSIVIPWNLAMIALVIIIFYKNPSTLSLFKQSQLKLNFLNSCIVILIWILPLFSKFNLWDHYLSFSLYSDKTSYFYISVKSNSNMVIDERLKPFIIDKSSTYFSYVGNITNGILIDINQWSLSELNVPFYPETRVFKTFSESFCNLSLINSEYIFIEKKAPLKNKSFYSFMCN